MSLFFWRDDWIYLWGAKYYPGGYFKILTDYYRFWPATTGLSMVPYLYLFNISDNVFFHQVIGFLIKLIVVILVYFFVKVVTNKKSVGIIAAVLYASSSVGLEAYGWHPPTALVIVFTLLGFIYYQQYLDKKEKKPLLFMLLFFFLMFCAYAGRSVGIFAMLLVWSLLLMIHAQSKRKEIKFMIVTIIVGLATILTLKYFTPLSSNQHLLSDIISHYQNYFASIGNAIRNPFFKIEEVGALTQYSKFSFYLGLLPLIGGIIAFPFYLIKKNKTAFLLLIFISWIYIFYLINWIFGGGSVDTIVGSSHRYIALSAIGVIVIEAILISKLPKLFMIIAVIVLVFLNFRYADFVVNNDYRIRGQSVVEHIYKDTSAAIKNHPHSPTILVIDNAGNLRNDAVMWSGPYPYAYYDNISQMSNFPTVIPDWNIAVQWLCGDSKQKRQLEATIGFSDYSQQYDSRITSSDVFAWQLQDDGTLIDKTSEMRAHFEDCRKTTHN